MDIVVWWMRTDQEKGDEEPSTAHTLRRDPAPHGPQCTGRLAASPRRGQGALRVFLPLVPLEAPVTQFCSRRGMSRPGL